MSKCMELFAFEANRYLTVADLDDEKTEFLIEDLLVKNSITMWYSKPSQGKTWFSYAIAKEILKDEGVKALYYCDFDNPKRQIKKRNVHKELLEEKKFKYFHKGKVDVDANGFLADINQEAYGSRFKDCVFLFDSTRDFVDNIYSDQHAKRFMEIMKNIREAGGTVILIHHTSKSGRVIDGSGEFTKSTDNAYELIQTDKTPGQIHYLLKVRNDRDSIKDCAFTVALETLDLKELDPFIAEMSKEDKEFTAKASSALSKFGELKQGDLLDEMGFKKDNKNALSKLKNFTDTFWQKEQRGKSIYYKQI